MKMRVDRDLGCGGRELRPLENEPVIGFSSAFDKLLHLGGKSEGKPRIY